LAETASCLRRSPKLRADSVPARGDDPP
jgi:hypothetical protein